MPERKFTATVKQPANGLGACGVAIHLENIDSNPSFGSHRLVIDLRHETTLEKANELASQLNRLGLSITLK